MAGVNGLSPLANWTLANITSMRFYDNCDTAIRFYMPFVPTGLALQRMEDFFVTSDVFPYGQFIDALRAVKPSHSPVES